ncbi:MAG: hypothetical protein WAU00_22880 [Caldilinea sp.]
MNTPLDWLLTGEPWVAYGARRELLGEPEDAAAVVTTRQAMLADAQVQQLLAELAGWPGTVIASHKSAGQPFHKLTLAADLGLRAGDPQIDKLVATILRHQSPEGPFQLPMPVDAQHRGSGEEQWGWALCDAPLIVYALIKFGLGRTPEVERALQHLTGLLRDNGWPCAVSKELGKFRGPGRKDDPCPFATLAMLKALAVHDDWRESEACHVGAETLLTLWRESRTRHPYMFYMGDDFRKLKVPLVWYDLVHVLDVLSRFPWLHDDARLLDMLDVLKGKADAQGHFTLESVWSAWKDWEFGQKREPSRWLTLTAWRISGRFEKS